MQNVHEANCCDTYATDFGEGSFVICRASLPMREKGTSVRLYLPFIVCKYSPFRESKWPFSDAQPQIAGQIIVATISRGWTGHLKKVNRVPNSFADKLLAPERSFVAHFPLWRGPIHSRSASLSLMNFPGISRSWHFTFSLVLFIRFERRKEFMVKRGESRSISSDGNLGFDSNWNLNLFGIDYLIAIYEFQMRRWSARFQFLP